MKLDSKLVVEFTLAPPRRGRKPAAGDIVPNIGKLPRITRLMALAIKFDGLIRNGVVADYADLARLGHVTRARLTQIMNLLLLAPDLQEELLFLPKTMTGRDPISERSIRQVTSIVRWDRQRRTWRQMLGRIGDETPICRSKSGPTSCLPTIPSERRSGYIGG